MITRRIAARLLTVTALLAASACKGDSTSPSGGSGGDGGGGGNNGSLEIAAAIRMANHNGASTISRVQGLFDGEVTDDQSWTPPLSFTTLEPGGVGNPGQHTVTIKVVSQSGSANYDFSGTVIAVNLLTGATQSIELADANRTLSAGGTYTYTFTLH